MKKTAYLAMIMLMGTMSLTVTDTVLAKELAMGENAVASGANATAIGNEAKASGEVAVALGSQSEAKETGSSAIGKGSQALTIGATAVGNHAVVNQNVYGTAIGTSAKTSGAYAVALGSLSEASGNKSLAMGLHTKAKHDAAIAIGENAVGERIHSIAMGFQASSQQDGAIAIGASAVAEAKDSIALGSGAKAKAAVATSNMKVADKTMDVAGTKPVGTLSIGDEGKERTITNLAAGQVSATSTDAVNGSQLHAVMTGVETNKNDISNLQKQVAQASDLQKQMAQVSDLQKRVQQVAAGAAALAGLHPLEYDPNAKVSVAVAGGWYKQDSAVALGGFYRPNENTMFSLAMTMGNGDAMTNAGISFKVGRQGTSRLADTEQAPMRVVRALEREIEMLKQQNASYEKRLDAQQAQIQQLLAKLG